MSKRGLGILESKHHSSASDRQRTYILDKQVQYKLNTIKFYEVVTEFLDKFYEQEKGFFKTCKHLDTFKTKVIGKFRPFTVVDLRRNLNSFSITIFTETIDNIQWFNYKFSKTLFGDRKVNFYYKETITFNQAPEKISPQGMKLFLSLRDDFRKRTKYIFEEINNEVKNLRK